MSDTTQQIKEKIDIADFLKQYLELKPAGKNFKALCPFHKEKTPSFMVSLDRQSWYCFGGCNEGGDIFQFLMKYENIEFYEALKVLAEKAGVALKTGQGVSTEYKQYGILYDINNAAKDYFKQALSGDALAYLLNRGLKQETINEFEIGFAPPSASGSDQLLKHLHTGGFDINDIERSGLVFKTDRGTYWDRFRQRIMFPLYNNFGKVVGFTGRLLKDDSNQAKYINSPETPIFNKSRLLYGLHKSKPYIRKIDWVLLVEGQMDFLMAYQDGVKNVVASSGTALTPEHLKTLRRLADKIMLSFDRDEAGQLAAERSIDLATAGDFTVKILNNFGEKDPAEMIRQQPGIMKQVIRKAQPAINFYFERYLNNSDNYKQNIRVVLSKINNIFSSIEQAIWLKELAAKTGIREEALLEELGKLPSNLNRFQQRSTGQSPNPQIQRSEETWSRKELIAARIFDLSGRLSISNWRPSEELALRSSLASSQIDSPEKELPILMRQFKIEEIKEKQQALKQIITRAEQENNEQLLAQKLKEFDILSKEFHYINSEKKNS